MAPGLLANDLHLSQELLMFRTAGAVVAGYVAMALVMVISLTGAYALTGSERAFEPGSYAVSGLWVFIMVVVNLLAALTGGITSARIDPRGKGVVILAAVVLGLGLTLALLQLSSPPSPEALIRAGDVDNTAAMQQARQPALLLLSSPVFGFVGVLLGARIWRAR